MASREIPGPWTDVGAKTRKSSYVKDSLAPAVVTAPICIDGCATEKTSDQVALPPDAGFGEDALDL
jgi:hypothetical protein